MGTGHDFSTPSTSSRKSWWSRRAAFEFRHESWLADEVYDRLRSRNLALCITDNEKATTPLVATADYGYFRLRDGGYQPADLQGWARKVAAYGEGLKDVFVYFKHEQEGKGPEFARALIDGMEAIRSGG